MRKKGGLDAKVGSNLPIFCGIVVIVSSGGDNHRSVEKLLRPSKWAAFVLGVRICR